MNKKNILVIDDHDIAAETVKQMLEILGHHVNTAYDGHTGLQKAAQSKPDIILLDISMPDMDGYETCRQLRKNPALQHTRIIAQTGWADDCSQDKISAAGFDDFLTKPFRIHDIETILERQAA